MSTAATPEISIRKCVPGDELALSIVGQASFLEAFAGVLSGRDIIEHCQKQHSAEQYRSYLADPRTSVWIAEIEPDSAPIGYLVLTTPDLPLPDLGPDDFEVKRIYLLHRFQRFGIGGRLMNEVYEHARKAGVTRLLLGVYQGNAAAIAFYKGLGYGKAGTRTLKVGEKTYDDVILELPLAASS